jgi:hypothetical protein
MVQSSDRKQKQKVVVWFVEGGRRKEEEVPNAEEEEEKGRMGKLGEGNRAKDLAGETDFNSLCAKSEKIT